MIKKTLGKISSITFGHTGYQDTMLGMGISLSGDGMGTGDSICFWDANLIKWTENCKWTEAGRDAEYAKIMRKLSDFLAEAKVHDVNDLVGIPVEMTFEGLTLKSWRILKEVL